MPTSEQNRAHIIARVLAWLRAGYPQGVPRSDYVALLGLLNRRLTDVEVDSIAEALAAAETSPESTEDIRAAIRAAVLEKPSDEDVARVRARLAAGGWPLAAPEDVPEAPPAPDARW